MEIKKFNQFINESGPSELDSKIDLQEEEVEWFSSEPALQKLISDNKISLLPPELWYTNNDQETTNILREFFPSAFNSDNENLIEDEINEPGFDEENESKIFKFENYRKMK